MNKVWCLIACALLPITGVAQVTVTFDIGAELLKDAAGNPMGRDGLVILAGSTSPNGFVAPTATQFFPNADDFELARWDLHNPGLEQDGVLFRFQNVNVTADFTPGTSPLQLYWFPGLTTAASAPGAGTQYGVFTDNIGHNGSDAWSMPGKSGGTEGTRTLRFATKDATTLFSPGEGFFDPSAGNASLTVVPEPSFYACALGVGCLGWAVARRFRSSLVKI